MNLEQYLQQQEELEQQGLSRQEQRLLESKPLFIARLNKIIPPEIHGELDLTICPYDRPGVLCPVRYWQAEFFFAQTWVFLQDAFEDTCSRSHQPENFDMRLIANKKVQNLWMVKEWEEKSRQQFFSTLLALRKERGWA